MIRKAIIKNIKEVINNHHKFNSAEFNISSKDQELKIIYDANEDFFLIVTIPNKLSTITNEVRENFMAKTVVKDETTVDYRFDGLQSPGKLSDVEEFSIYGENKFYSVVKNWLTQLYDELVAINDSKLWDIHEKAIQSIKDNLSSIPDDYFTIEEANVFKQKLEEFEQQINKKLQEEIEDKNILKSKLNELHQEIDTLKKTVHSMSKKGAIKSTVSKIFGWIAKEDNRKFVGEVIQTIKPLLPEGVQQSLPPHLF